MKIWLTTDSHLGHANMIPYCGRPKGFEEMILTRLYEVVKEDDILIHLGDVCFGNDAFWHEKFMGVLGRKWLIRGNHDKKTNKWYIEHGWDFVCAKFQNKYFGKNILFSHTPERQVYIHEPLFISGKFDINIHGHFHNNLPRLEKGDYRTKGEKKRNIEDLANLTEKHKLLALEYTDYKPVLLEKFI